MQCQVKDAVPFNCTCNHFRASNARARAPARRARKSEAYQGCATAAMEESNTKANLINSSSQSPMRRKEVERRQLSGRRCKFEDFRTTFEELHWIGKRWARLKIHTFTALSLSVALSYLEGKTGVYARYATALAEWLCLLIKIDTIHLV